MQGVNGNEVITPSSSEAELARETFEKLAAHLGHPGEIRLEVGTGAACEQLALPPSVIRLLVRVLAEIGQGHEVALHPLRAELTTQQAADILNVSRPHLVKLLDEGAIPSRRVGTHRRVLADDLLAYKQAFRARRQASLDELAALSQELGMGY